MTSTAFAVDERLPMPDTVIRGSVRWLYAVPIVTVHALALAAFVPWLFSWTGLIVMVVGVHVFGQAINLCYHRLLAHRSARVPVWLEHFFVIVGLCCMQDTPGKWVATHRFHHNHSDEQPDPHSPLVNFLWSHVGWLVVHNRGTNNIETYRKFAPDIFRDPFYLRLEKGLLPVWIYLPRVPEIQPNTEQIAELTALAKQAGFITFDLTGLWGDREIDDLVISQWDLHPNAQAHRIMAEATIAAMRSDPRLGFSGSTTP